MQFQGSWRGYHHISLLHIFSRGSLIRGHELGILMDRVIIEWHFSADGISRFVILINQVQFWKLQINLWVYGRGYFMLFVIQSPNTCFAMSYQGNCYLYKPSSDSQVPANFPTSVWISSVYLIKHLIELSCTATQW